MKRTHLRAAVVAVVAAAVTLTGCSSSTSGSTGTSSDAPTTITSVNLLTDFVANGVQSPFFYGIEKGYYKDEGIDLKVTAGTGSGNTVTAIAGGQADIGDALSVNYAQAVAKGTKLLAVGWYRANSAFAFFCDEKLDIKTAAQLKGHSILTPTGGAQTAFLPSVLEAAGLSTSDVTIDAVDSKTVGSTYAGGQDDCIVQTLGDAPTYQTKRPSTTISWTDAGFTIPGFAFFVTQDYYDAHKDVIAAFLTATYKSIAESVTDPTAAVSAFTAANPTVDPTLAAAQFEASSVVYCTTAEASAGSVFGSMSDDEWTSLVTRLNGNPDLLGGATISDPKSLYTNEFFTGSDPVSTTACSSQYAS